MANDKSLGTGAGTGARTGTGTGTGTVESPVHFPELQPFSLKVLCMCELLCMGPHGSGKRTEEGVSCVAWVLEAELSFSVRAASSLSH